MADRYAVTGSQTAVEASPGETILNLFTAAITDRAEIYYMSFSAGGTMADQVQTVQVQRTTAVGTEGAGVVPAPLDKLGPASVHDGAENHSVEPTYTSATELFEQDLHIRALAQVQLQPDGHLKNSAVASEGIATRSFSSNYTGGAKTTYHFEE